MTATTTIEHGFRPGSARAALAYPDFRRMWIASFASNIGTWMQNVVLPAYVYERTGKASIADAYASHENSGIWLINAYIPEYLQANRFNHEPNRPRKLLLKKRKPKLQKPPLPPGVQSL